jgi:DNA primase catalytic core
MEHEKKNFPETLYYLAAKYNIIIEEEKLDPEQKKAIDLNEKLYHLNEMAVKFYQGSTNDYIQKRFTKEEIEQWQIGYATDSWDDLLKFFREKKVLEEVIEKSDLFGFSEKTKNNYDFFRNRVMFPIIDNMGRVAAFGGRVLDDSLPKYLNSPDSSIYPKSRTLYGLNFARKEISKLDNCHIVEGYTDVISMHTAGVINTVAPCGTALTVDQLNLIRRYTRKLTLIYDSDPAGKDAALKNGILSVEKGFDVYICLLPEGEDPDTFFKGKSQAKSSEWLSDNNKDFILYYSDKLLSGIKDSPLKESEAIIEICKLLSILDKTKQDTFVTAISKASKIKPKLFFDKLYEYKNEADPKKEKNWIPKDLDPVEFETWGFYSLNNEYYFRVKGGIEKLSNFIMKPIFHITSTFDSRRIFELVNVFGARVVVSLDMQMITSMQSFQKEIEGQGNFMFWGKFEYLQKLKQKLYEETRTCEEIKILGWQKEGFWAWSNGIISGNGDFKEIDEYGVVKYNEYNYFIPAFSKIYITDKSVFLDERKFKYLPGKITIRQWTELFTEVHGDNSFIGFAFYLASLFRDHILYLFDNFPILNLFGPRGSGKNTMAYSILSLFGKKQTEFNIHNGTKAGLAKHLELFSNAIAFVDEYKNNLDFEKIETLKSIYNAIGRSRINIDKGNKKETTAVNQSVILAGQEMPTIDAALSSRVIFLQFTSKEGLPADKKKNLEKLQKIERDGLPHLTVEIIKYRKYFEDNYKHQYDKVLSDFMEKVDKEQIDERILRNMVSVCAAFKTLEDKIDFSFSYQTLIEKGIEVIQNHNDQLKKSDDLGIFWNLIEALFDENILIDRWHFRVDLTQDLKITKQITPLSFSEPKLVLKLKYNITYKLYAENAKKQGIKPLPSDTLKYYLETNKSFFGVIKSCRFSQKVWDKSRGEHIFHIDNTSAFCFDFKKLGINLQREYKDTVSGFTTPDEENEVTEQIENIVTDNLPF